jgi:hypothetical protein
MSFTERLQQEFIERIQRVLAELADKVEFDLGLRSGIHQLAAYPRTRGFSHADVVRAATARYYKQLGESDAFAGVYGPLSHHCCDHSACSATRVVTRNSRVAGKAPEGH